MCVIADSFGIVYTKPQPIVENLFFFFRNNQDKNDF